MGARIILGWSEGLTRWHDGTRLFHLMVAKNVNGFSVAVPACGTTRAMGGQVEARQPDNACQRCAKIARKEPAHA